MNQIFLAIGSGLFLVLGLFHGIMALRDVFKPRTFTPVDDSVRKAMTNVPIALHPKTDLWKAWLGFNLSHSLGLIVFGSSTLFIALFSLQLFTQSILLQVVIILVSTIYLILSLKFWFSKPAIASSIAIVCFILSVLLS